MAGRAAEEAGRAVEEGSGGAGVAGRAAEQEGGVVALVAEEDAGCVEQCAGVKVNTYRAMEEALGPMHGSVRRNYATRLQVCEPAL